MVDLVLDCFPGTSMPPFAAFHTAIHKLDPRLIGSINSSIGNEVRYFLCATVRFLKVGRTIADFEGAEDLEAKDLSEAAQYRMLDRNLWLQS